MSTTEIAPEELLQLATAMATADRNMEIMDRSTILRGYMQLTKLDPTNNTFRKNVEDAISSLLEVAFELRS